MIPKIIHYCWFGGRPLPKSAIKCINSWKKFFPDYEIKEWNESNFDVNMIPYTREAYKAKKYAFVSDFARFWVLHEYGGIYFDTDVEVIRSMDDIIEKGAYMGAETPRNVAPGLGIACEPKHPFYKRYIEYFSDKHFTPSQPTMCRVVTDWWLEKGWKTDGNSQTIDSITIYSQDYFCPQAMIGASINITDNTRSIHHFDASWLPWWKKILLQLKQKSNRLLPFTMIPNQHIRDDLFRYEGRFTWFLFFRYFLFTPGFRYSCIWRWTQSACRLTKPFWILLLRHYQVKYAIQIPYQTEIGRGFRINHWGAIVINPKAKIGHNFNIAQGALVGNAPPSSKNKKQSGGAPTIGNNVSIGANAIVIGKINIGDNCIIAPGAFVNQDMPTNTIAIGNPASFHHKTNASDSLIVYKL